MQPFIDILKNNSRYSITTGRSQKIWDFGAAFLHKSFGVRIPEGPAITPGIHFKTILHPLLKDYTGKSGFIPRLAFIR